MPRQKPWWLKDGSKRVDGEGVNLIRRDKVPREVCKVSRETCATSDSLT